MMIMAVEFIPTVFSNDDFEAFEREGKLALSPEMRMRIQDRVHQYERQVEYERSGAGERLLKDMLMHAANLRASVGFARNLDANLPGHLWSKIAADADLNGDCELARLEAVCDAFDRQNAYIAQARGVKTRDFKLYDLLGDLESIFKAATNGGKTGVSNGDGTRGGRFVRFADAILGRLGQCRRRTASVGSRWQKIYSDRKQGRKRPRRVWVGKAPPSFAKRRAAA
jgi:hypothetical protein